MASRIIDVKENPDQRVCRSNVQIIVVGDKRCGKTKFIEIFARRLENKMEDDVSQCAIMYSAQYIINSIFINVKIIEISCFTEHLVYLLTKDRFDVHGIIFMYGIDDPSGFEAMEGNWIQTLEDNGCKTDQPSILVGNKRDLREDQQVVERLARDNQGPVTRQKGEDLKNDRSLQDFFEISCVDKNDQAAHEAFHSIVQSSVEYLREATWLRLMELSEILTPTEN